MARLVLALIFLLTLSGCGREHCCDLYDWLTGDVEYKIPLTPETIAINEEIARTLVDYGVKIDQDRNLYVESSYAKRSMNGKYWIWMDLTSQRILDVPGARRMMVNLVEGLLEALNGNEKLRGIQTFTPQDLYVSVELESFFGRYIDSLYVARVELFDGELVASYAHDCFQCELETYHKHIEFYQMSKVLVAEDDKVRSEYKSIYDPLKSLYQEQPEEWETPIPNASLKYVPVESNIKKTPVTPKSTTTNKPQGNKAEAAQKALKYLNQ